MDWLIARGLAREAHDQAMIGLYYAPGQPDLLAALERATDALARGTSPDASSRSRGNSQE